MEVVVAKVGQKINIGSGKGERRRINGRGWINRVGEVVMVIEEVLVVETVAQEKSSTG